VVFDFENHAWKELLVVDVRLVIFYSGFPNFGFFRVSYGVLVSWVVFRDDVSDCALGFSTDG